MVDTFQIDRKAWELAKQQLTPNAPHSSIALLAEEIKQALKKELANAVNDQTSSRDVAGE